MKDIFDFINDFATNSKEAINVQLPCIVTEVQGNKCSVLMVRNDELENLEIHNVPIKRPETQRAYIFLGIKKDDYGVLKFFDKNIENYIEGDLEFNGDNRSHSIDDRCFELGFVPDNKSFIYPENVEIEIGLKNKSALINFNDGIINIAATNVNIAATNINIGSATTIDGKIFLEHQHSNGNLGNPTGGVI